MGNYHEDICTYMKISCLFLLRMRNVSHTQVVEKIKNRAIHNMEKYGRARNATDDITLW